MSHNFYGDRKDRQQDAAIQTGVDVQKAQTAADLKENVQERKDEALDERQMTALTKRVSALETGFPVPVYPNLESLIARVVALESTTPIDAKIQAFKTAIEQQINALGKRMDELVVSAGPVR